MDPHNNQNRELAPLWRAKKSPSSEMVLDLAQFMAVAHARRTYTTYSSLTPGIFVHLTVTTLPRVYVTRLGIQATSIPSNGSWD